MLKKALVFLLCKKLILRRKTNMITIYTFEEIKELEGITEVLKKELLKYFREIAEGIVGEEWDTYDLEEVGPILVIEDKDTVQVLDEYGLMQGSKSVPLSYPEFALKITVGDVEMLKMLGIDMIPVRHVAI
jgi:hypothetical protein